MSTRQVVYVAALSRLGMLLLQVNTNTNPGKAILIYCCTPPPLITLTAHLWQHTLTSLNLFFGTRTWHTVYTLFLYFFVVFLYVRIYDNEFV